MGQTIKQQYADLSPKLLKAMAWIDSPDRTKEEVDRWYPRYKIMFDEITKLERIMRR